MHEANVSKQLPLAKSTKPISANNSPMQIAQSQCFQTTVLCKTAWSQCFQTTALCKMHKTDVSNQRSYAKCTKLMFANNALLQICIKQMFAIRCLLQNCIEPMFAIKGPMQKAWSQYLRTTVLCKMHEANVSEQKPHAKPQEPNVREQISLSNLR